MSVVPNRNYSLDDAVAELERNFVAENPNSVERFDSACQSMPGGNTRTVLHYSPLPLAIEKGEDCYVWDMDGHKYTDFVCEYSAGLYGHSNPAIQAAVRKAIDDGVVLGGPNVYEAKLSQALTDRFPSLDYVRFCNSGSEADLMALSVARAVTGRDKVMVFAEAYHGGFLIFGHGGSPLNVPFPMVVAQYNDTAGALTLIEQEKDDLAAVILEPMQFGGGCIAADVEFLQALRDATRDNGIVLVYDEVVTSRLAPGGLQELTGVIPDMTTLGKYLGGGSSFGAFGGRAELMERFDPRAEHNFPHAGTFNNNVVSMAAGYAGISEVYTPAVARDLNERGDALRERLNAVIRTHDVDCCVTGLGSVMTLHFTRGPIHDPSTIPDSPRERKLFHLYMLGHGQYVASRGLMVLSLPMGDAQVDALVDAFSGFLQEYAPLLG